MNQDRSKVEFTAKRKFAAYAHNDANGKWIATVLLGALHIHFEYARRGKLGWKYFAGRGWPWWGRGTMGVCFAIRPFYIAFSHNERPEDRTRRLLRDVAREDQVLAERVNS